MPPRAALVITASTAATTLGPGDTSIDKGDSQVVTRGQLQEMVDHLQDNMSTEYPCTDHRN